MDDRQDTRAAMAPYSTPDIPLQVAWDLVQAATQIGCCPICGVAVTRCVHQTWAKLRLLLSHPPSDKGPDSPDALTFWKQRARNAGATEEQIEEVLANG